MVNIRKSIMFIIPSLVEGGAEKVLIDIINHLKPDKYAMSLVLFEKKGVYLSSIPSYVKTYDLKKKNRYSFFKLVFRLAELLRGTKPDVVLSFMEYTDLVAVLAKFLSRRKFSLIISVHTHLTSALSCARYRKLRAILYKILFNCSDLIIVPSTGVKQDLVETFDIREGKIEVIHNPMDLRKIDKLRGERIDKTSFGEYILAVGRLTKQKGYPHLLKAYSLVNKRIDAKLLILGTGEEDSRLRSLARELKIENDVFFLGFEENPYKFMKNASILVLSSLWASFEIVIVESMACGTPVISTDCPSGPGEIITHSRNGILVPPADEEALAEAILALLRNKALRKTLSEEARKRAEDFRIEKILPQYEGLFLR